VSTLFSLPTRAETCERRSIVVSVRCPWCSVDDDRVVDSRLSDEGAAIRRRRECLGCGRRFTTFERVEEAPLWVLKRAGIREPFDRAKLIAGVRAACKNRPVSEDELIDLAQQVEEALRVETAEPTSQQVGVAVLERLQSLDEVAYVRFASVYKGFEDLGDFQREVGLLNKTTEPKRRG
jgi:transcriptional repressor NrdR